MEVSENNVNKNGSLELIYIYIKMLYIIIKLDWKMTGIS